MRAKVVAKTVKKTRMKTPIWISWLSLQTADESEMKNNQERNKLLSFVQYYSVVKREDELWRVRKLELQKLGGVLGSR